MDAADGAAGHGAGVSNCRQAVPAGRDEAKEKHFGLKWERLRDGFLFALLIDYFH